MAAHGPAGDSGTDGHVEPEEEFANKDPEAVTWAIQTVVETVQTYGWFILLGALALYLLYQRLRPSLQQYQEQKERDSYKKMDSGEALSKLEAMEQARRRMQAEMDEKSKAFVEKQQEKEAKKREERLADWEMHQQGRGYHNKTKRPSDRSSKQSPSSASKQDKKPLRPDYNPLMGDVGGACFRPTRRTGPTGGG